MQHHVHANAVRRATHHHGHHQNLGHAHHMAMHPGLEQQPPPPQPQQPQAAHARLNHHHQQQQHQQPGTGATAVYHHSNAGNINGSSNNNNNNNNNSNNNQMQKIRQQHQHLNNNNNNSNNISNNNNCNSSNGHSGKCHNHPPPPLPQAYNQLPYNQLPPPPPPGTHPQHPHMAAAHLSSYAPHPPPPTHYYMSQAKPSKYNNNNNSNNNAHYSANTNNNNNCGSNSNSNSTNYAPKTILQNTYRQSKVNGQQLPAHSVQEANSNNIIIATEAVVVAAAGAAEEIIEQCPVGLPPPPLSELPVEIPTDGDKCSSSSSLSTDIQPQIDSTLPNEDHGVSASGRNGKDKTPMCLVNELARYNKITHQYRLTGERGPAHCKTFTVTLKLGDEEYSADGFKIKKAQHLAASKAIEETKYKHPPPKIRRSESEGSSSRTHITPTVELNALAMKLGQRTYYLLDPTQIPPADAAMQMPLPPEYGGVSLLPTPAAAAAAAAAGLTQQQQQQPQQQSISIAPPPPAFIRRQFVQLGGPPMHPHGIYGGHQRTGQYPAKYHASRYALPPPPPHLMHGAYGAHHTPMPVTPSKITLFVGKQKFVGTGRTLQQAKHDAAARALQVLKTQASATATSASDEALEDSMDEGDKKSPISQVHEIGIKRSMTVHFKVLREEGPAHMKNFITACIVGSIVTEGEGNGKKISKKRSAEKMLIELHKLPPLTPTKQTPMKRIKVKTPGKNSSSSGTATTDPTATPLPGKLERRKRLSAPNKEKLLEQLDDAENPITKLIQLQQNRKDKEPIFELIAKNGNDTSRRREFVMEVSANGSTARGTGNSKKLAKRNAAQALLELLETAEPSVNVKSQNTKETPITATGATKDLVTVAVGVDVPMVSTPAGPVPGILILRQNKKPSKKKASMEAKEDGKEKGKESTTKTAPAAATVTTPTAVVTAATEAAAGTTNVAANATETSSSEGLLNTSTGSNTSGVSSNSSNTGATTNSTSTSNTTSNSNSNNSSSSSSIAGVHMKEQLLYLSKLLDFEVNFSDYPKGNHNEFLTIVTLSTNPPQICHGVGKSSEESQNDAARSALKILSELGLNNAKK